MSFLYIAGRGRSAGAVDSAGASCLNRQLLRRSCGLSSSRFSATPRSSALWDGFFVQTRSPSIEGRRTRPARRLCAAGATSGAELLGDHRLQSASAAPPPPPSSVPCSPDGASVRHYPGLLFSSSSRPQSAHPASKTAEELA